jgi:hypothetical protein
MLRHVVEQNTSHCKCVASIGVFGSFARGAAEVGDVDLAVEIDTRRDQDINRKQLDRIVTGADLWSGWQTALGARSPILEIHFERALAKESMILLYAAGDPLPVCQDRIRALATTQDGARTPRHWEHAKTTSLQGLEHHFGFTTASLDLLVARAAVTIERLDLIDTADSRPPRGLSWSAQHRLQSGHARTIRAALAYLDQLNVAPADIALLDDAAYTAGTRRPPGHKFAWQVLWTGPSLKNFLQTADGARTALYLLSPRAQNAPFVALTIGVRSASGLRRTLERVDALRSQASSETKSFETFNEHTDELLHDEITAAQAPSSASVAT